MIYHIEPVLESFIWGGRRIIDAYHLETDLKNVGQIYHVIALKGHQDCIVTEARQPLSRFYETHPEIFRCKAPVFPVRLATSCSEKKMSYHLHPGNGYALTHEGTLERYPDQSPSSRTGQSRSSSLGTRPPRWRNSGSWWSGRTGRGCFRR